jgi:hypothetical protein
MYIYTLGKACSLGPHMLLRQENSGYHTFVSLKPQTGLERRPFLSRFSHNSSLIHSTNARASSCSKTQCAIDSAEITLLLDECTLERWGTAASIYAVNSPSTRCNNGL